MTAEPTTARRRRGLRLFSNPVVLKELRGRMRGSRAFAVLTVYLLLMSGFTALLYVLSASARDIYGFTSGGTIGRTLFTGIVAVELFLVTFIAPAFTAGAISGERERQTYDLLRTTLLPARALVIGKLASALSYVLLLLLAAIPLQSIAFLFGGVTETEVVLAFIILAVTALVLGALGIYFSASMPRTLAANVTTYAVTLGITIGLPLVAFVFVAMVAPRINTTTPLPVQLFLLYGMLALAATNPLVAAYASQFFLLNHQSIGLFTITITYPANDPTSGLPIYATLQAPVISPWLLFTGLYLIVAAFLILKAVRRVRRIEAW